MESSLPTLDDILDPDNLDNNKNGKKQSNSDNERKNEIESKMNEEIKMEESKDNESQNEIENKINNEDHNKSEIQINQEPQKKITTKDNDNLGEENDLGKIIKVLNLIVLNGNELFKKKLYDEAIINIRKDMI